MTIEEITKKVAHLGYIQGVINRMGNNSFLIKGWLIAVASGSVALFYDKNKSDFLYIGLILIVLLWITDAFYLHQERLYRKLYDYVAEDNAVAIPFSMNTKVIKDGVDSFSRVMFSKTLVFFYGLSFVMILSILIKEGKIRFF